MNITRYLAISLDDADAGNRRDATGTPFYLDWLPAPDVEVAQQMIAALRPEASFPIILEPFELTRAARQFADASDGDVLEAWLNACADVPNMGGDGICPRCGISAENHDTAILSPAGGLTLSPGSNLVTITDTTPCTAPALHEGLSALTITLCDECGHFIDGDPLACPRHGQDCSRHQSNRSPNTT